MFPFAKVGKKLRNTLVKILSIMIKLFSAGLGLVVEHGRFMCLSLF